MKSMTIIQGLKRIKQLDRKIEKFKDRNATWGSYISCDTPAYTADELAKMRQSASDLLVERATIRHAMHVLNATAEVEFEGKKTTIDELLIEATKTIPELINMLRSMRRREKSHQHSREDTVVMQFNPAERDKTVDALDERRHVIMDFIDQLNITLVL